MGKEASGVDWERVNISRKRFVGSMGESGGE